MSVKQAVYIENMKIITIFLGVFFLSCIANAQRNVILIIADDLGTDYCGFYEDRADTAALPNLRRLLNRGVRFTNPMSNPVCSPTRAGILTGRYSFRTGIGDAVGGVGSAVIDTSEVTIPRILKLYNPAISTANIGKWHLSMQTPASNLLTPNWMGYDHYSGIFLGTVSSYTSWTKVTNGISSTSTNYATSEIANDAISWIKTQGANPFFLWLAFNAPHTPLHLPPAGLHSFTGLSGTTADINANPKLYFKASLEALDHEIGRLLDSLIVLNKYDSTDIIFIGDNGNGLRSSQITDTNRAKGSIYQYGVKVPFIISGPSVISTNRISNALVNTTDLFASIIELFGCTTWPVYIPASKQVDSKSLLPILKNIDTVVRPWAFTEVFKVVTDSQDGIAMRNLTYKLLNFNYGHQEFYNVAIDPNESNDLLDSILSPTEIINYNYLCNEMSTLTGSSTVCDSSVRVKQTDNTGHNYLVYPNPFTSFVRLPQVVRNDTYELSNFLGQIVYRGPSIEKQDFSSLPSGVYSLRNVTKGNIYTRLIKN